MIILRPHRINRRLRLYECIKAKQICTQRGNLGKLRTIANCLRHSTCINRLNAYYVFIHPYLPLLPAPLGPVYEDQSVTIHVHADQSTSSIKELLPWWPLSPLSLALSSILALITLDEPSPGSTFWRRACSDIFANSALKSIDHDLESLRPVFTRGCSEQIRGRDNRTPFHKNVHSHLEAILALVTLSAFEYCRHGNIGKMRIRINLAVTTAIDMSLHDLGRGTQDVCEPQRRAWWMTVGFIFSLSQGYNSV